jgi:hypothetical protein
MKNLSSLKDFRSKSSFSGNIHRIISPNKQLNMQLLTSFFAISTLLAGINASPAAPSATSINWFPTTCDNYACGWCHWYWDNKKTPDGGPAYQCLTDDSEGAWLSWYVDSPVAWHGLIYVAILTE